MLFVQKYLDFFIPDNVKQSPVSYRKGIVLTAMHIFIIISMAIMGLQTMSLKEFTIPVYPFFPVVLLMLFGFKKWGNLNVSGNALTFLWMGYIGLFVPSTGGIHSDNIIWMMAGPLISLLLTTRLWGAFWMFALVAFFTSVYFYGLKYPEISGIKFSDTYYYTSYMFAGNFIFFVMVIFEGGQTFIVNLLNDKNAILEEQKQAIAQQTEDLMEVDLKLRKSNEDLQTFAYTASHDLKEPLRMIGMYTQLLQKRLASKVDEREEEYIYYITDGVKRMQKLLDDLLSYSRLGKNTEDVKSIDLNDALLMVTHNLTVAIKDTNTSIISKKMPNIVASSTEMSQLFQNLIANAVKFRKIDVAPVIEILCEKDEEFHIFGVKDNGIGIKKEYQEQVFNLFTRLNSRVEFEGSGIGLATCRKIVEGLGGKMWVASEEGEGTTFYFTLPLSLSAIPESQLSEILKKEDPSVKSPLQQNITVLS